MNLSLEARKTEKGFGTGHHGMLKMKMICASWSRKAEKRKYWVFCSLKIYTTWTASRESSNDVISELDKIPPHAIQAIRSTRMITLN